MYGHNASVDAIVISDDGKLIFDELMGRDCSTVGC